MTRTAGWNVPRLDGRGTKYWVERGLVGACHLAVVIALISDRCLALSGCAGRHGRRHAVPPLAVCCVLRHANPPCLTDRCCFGRSFSIAARWLPERWSGPPLAACSFPPSRFRSGPASIGSRCKAICAVAVTAGVSLILTVGLLWWDGRIGVVWQTISQPDWLPWRAPQNASEGFWAESIGPIVSRYSSSIYRSCWRRRSGRVPRTLPISWHCCRCPPRHSVLVRRPGRRLRLVVFTDPAASGVATELERPPAAHSRIGR